jgi:hypothetical protein
VLVGKNNDVLAKDNKEITNFFSVPVVLWLPLVSVNARIASQRQKRLLAKFAEIFFSRGDAATFFDWFVLRFPSVCGLWAGIHTAPGARWGVIISFAIHLGVFAPRRIRPLWH